MARRPKSMSFLLVTAAALLFGSSSKASPLILDSFSGGSYLASGATPLNGMSGSLGLVNDLPGSVVVTHSSPAVGTFGSVASNLYYNSAPFGGQFVLSTTNTGQIQAGLQYAFAGGTLELTSGITLDFAGINPGTLDDFDFQAIVNTTGGPLAPVNFVFPASLGGPITIDDASWHGVDITGITLLFNANVLPNGTGFAADFSLNEIRIADGNFNINEIPEPASMAVFGLLTLAGGVIARRRMAKAAA